jgi:tetrahydromethanopterin S-methyltransferase subunit E
LTLVYPRVAFTAYLKAYITATLTTLAALAALTTLGRVSGQADFNKSRFSTLQDVMTHLGEVVYHLLVTKDVTLFQGLNRIVQKVKHQDIV